MFQIPAKEMGFENAPFARFHFFKNPQNMMFEQIQFCPDPNSNFLPSIKLFHIYGKMDLEKLITTNSI